MAKFLIVLVICGIGGVFAHISNLSRKLVAKWILPFTLIPGNEMHLSFSSGEIPQLSSHFDRKLFNDLVTDFDSGFLLRSRPFVYIEEGKETYEFSADLPGVKKSDISLTIMDGVMTISGRRKMSFNSKDSKGNTQTSEDRVITKSITLPFDVDEEKITASFEDGVLAVRLPKLHDIQGQKMKRIPIK